VPPLGNKDDDEDDDEEPFKFKDCLRVASI
jgi:hypothetical protein